ncbi:MAG: VCBS repeat-containing protein [Sandaracinaceae bacterium]|nr:VCBS repeat-containing protein [Sandaracinaceae bacterium]
MSGLICGLIGLGGCTPLAEDDGGVPGTDAGTDAGDEVDGGGSDAGGGPGTDAGHDGGCPGGGPFTYYADDDGDGYGDPAVSVLACSAPDDYVEDATDCDDGHPGIYPGSTATEVPGDGLDMDCDGYDGCSDLDCNGRPDIAFLGATVETFLNTGAGFTSDSMVPVQGAGTANVVSGPITGTSADLDGDGYLDIATIFYNDSRSCTHNILWGGPDGYSIARSTYLDHDGAASGERDSGTRHMRIFDMDGDGNLDIALATYWIYGGTGRDTDAAVYYGNGSRGFVNRDYPAAQAYTIDAGDIDHDGNPDLVIGRFANPGDVRVYWGTPMGPRPTSTPTILATQSVTDVDLVDLDGDGDLDIVAGTYDDRSDVFLFDASAGRREDGFSDTAGHFTLDTGNTRQATEADLDGDGCHELLFSGATSQIFEGTRSGGGCTWPSTASGTFATTPSRQSLVADLNGDTYPDVAIVSSSTTDVYFGTSSGVPRTSPVTLSKGGLSLTAGDLEGDGVLDLVVGDDDPVVFWGRPGATTYSDARSATLTTTTGGTGTIIGEQLTTIGD